MDDLRFDGLARVLGGQQSRRGALRVAGIGMLAGVLPTLVAPPDADAQQFHGEACQPVGTRCGRRRKDGVAQPRCTKCCTRYTKTQRNGQRRCACMPDFTPCRRADQCCSGICDVDPCGCDEGPATPMCLPGLFAVP